MPNFKDPSAGGDKLPLAELEGSLLLFDVVKQADEMMTSFGPASPIVAHIVALDGAMKGQRFDDALVFPRKLQGQLRSSIGEMVIGRLGKGTAKAGQSPPWELTAATDADKAIGERYCLHWEQQKIADEEPF